MNAPTNAGVLSRSTALEVMDSLKGLAAFMADRFVYEHGDRAIGGAWGAAEASLVKVRAELFPERRYVSEPDASRPGWCLFDTRHPMGRMCVMRGFGVVETLSREDELNQVDTASAGR